MDKGILLFVQESPDTDYLQQARICAKSIKYFNPDEKICLMTDCKKDLSNYNEFDIIKTIPGDDLAKDSVWKIENRCKIYDVSPFKHTIVMDVDVMVLENIEHYWNYLKNFEIFYVTQPYTYRQELITEHFYRQVFVKNNLPNVYCGFHYFKRSSFAQKFYDTIKDIVINYEFYKKRYTPELPQQWCSMDVSTAIAIKLIDCESKVCSKQNPIKFIHMKSKVQNWVGSAPNWIQQVDFVLNNDLELVVGNHKQTGIFHYVEAGFVNDNIKGKLNV